MKTDLSTLSDEDILSHISGTTTTAPAFRGKPLHPFTRGIKDLAERVVAEGDTIDFHDAAMLKILGDAYGQNPAEIAKNRQALLSRLTTDRDGFRTEISLHLDTLTAEDIAEARKVVSELLAPPAPPAPPAPKVDSKKDPARKAVKKRNRK